MLKDLIVKIFKKDFLYIQFILLSIFILTRIGLILSHPAMTLDEYASIDLSSYFFKNLPHLLQNETNPPFYYLYMLFFTWIPSHNEFLIRLSTLLPSIVFMLWYFFYNQDKVIHFLVSIYVIFPKFVYRSYEARSYGITIVLFLYLFAQLLKYGDLKTKLHKIYLFLFVNLHFFNILGLWFFVIFFPKSFLKKQYKFILFSFFFVFVQTLWRYLFGDFMAISWISRFQLSQLNNLVSLWFIFPDVWDMRVINFICYMFIAFCVTAVLFFLRKRILAPLLFMICIVAVFFISTVKPIIAPHCVDIILISLISIIALSLRYVRYIAFGFFLLFSIIIVRYYNETVRNFYYIDARVIANSVDKLNILKLPVLDCFINSHQPIGFELHRKYQNTFVDIFSARDFNHQDVYEYAPNHLLFLACNQDQIVSLLPRLQNGFYFFAVNTFIDKSYINFEDNLKKLNINFSKKIVLESTGSLLIFYKLMEKENRISI